MAIYCHFPATWYKLCYITKIKAYFSAFKFSNVSYCFVIKAIKHKISKVFIVTCVQIEQLIVVQFSTKTVHAFI